MTTISCPTCAQKLLVDDQNLGQRMKCPKCGQIFMLASQQQQPPPQPAQRPPAPAPPPQPAQPQAAPPPPPPAAAYPPPATPPRRPPAPGRAPRPSLFSSSLDRYGARWGLVWGIALIASFVFPMVSVVHRRSFEPSGWDRFPESRPGRPGRGGALQDVAPSPGLAVARPVEASDWDFRDPEPRPPARSYRPPPAATDEINVFFPNIMLLTGERVPAEAKLLALYPLLAGIAMILLATLARGYGLAAGMVAVGAVHVLLSLICGSTMMGPIARLPGIMVAIVLAALALVGVFAGLRIQRVDPLSNLGRLLAGIAASVYLLVQVLPVLPPEAGSVLLALPFKLMEGPVFVAVWLLLMMAALSTVAVLACVTFGTNPRTNSRLARAGILILLITIFTAPYLLILAGEITEQRPALAILLEPLTGSLILYLGYGILAAIAIGVIEFYNAATAGRPQRAYAPVQPSPRQWAPAAGAPSAMPPQAPTLVTPLAPPPIRPSAPPLAMPSAPPPQPQPAGTGDIGAKLEQLDKLRKAGLITDADYEAKKRQLLDRL